MKKMSVEQTMMANGGGYWYCTICKTRVGTSFLGNGIHAIRYHRKGTENGTLKNYIIWKNY